MILKNFKSFVFLFACFFLLAPLISWASPEEIQVYLDEFTETGRADLEIHNNYVLSGVQHFHVTPEVSYGVNPNWEVGAYWLGVKYPGSSIQTDGVKVRARWRPRAPSMDSPYYWAINYEIGQLSRRADPDGTSEEIKLIGVWRSEPWLVGANLNLDRALKIHPVQAASTDVDFKVSYWLSDEFRVGVENYCFLGANHKDPAQPGNSNANYLALDFKVDGWDFNVGIGRVFGDSPDRTVFKLILGFP